MTRYFWLKTRSITLNPATVFWSVFFVLFWAIMWIYVFGTDITRYSSEPWYAEAVSSYVAAAFGSLGIISMGSTGIGLTQGVLNAVAATRFITRFTRLGPLRLLAEDLGASILGLITPTIAIIVATMLLAWQRYGVLVRPHNPLALLTLLLVLGVFFYLFALVSGYIALSASSKHVRSIMSGLSLIVSFVPYAFLFTGHGNLAGYIYPPVGIQALIIGSVSGETPPATNIIGWFKTRYLEHQGYTPISAVGVAASTILWLLAMSLLSMVLARRARAVHPAEIG